MPRRGADQTEVINETVTDFWLNTEGQSLQFVPMFTKSYSNPTEVLTTQYKKR